jgi:hypothetical protein
MKGKREGEKAIREWDYGVEREIRSADADENLGETAGGTTRNTQIQRSRMSDLSFHAGFEVCLSSPIYIMFLGDQH